MACVHQKRIQEQTDLDFEDQWRNKDPPPAYEQPPSYKDAIMINTNKIGDSKDNQTVNINNTEVSTDNQISNMKKNRKSKYSTDQQANN